MRFKDRIRNMVRADVAFVAALYTLSVFLRLYPKLRVDSHLLAFQGDVWYRVCMAQYIYDHWSLPEPDIRYRAYGYVPMWYPPLSPFMLAVLSRISWLDIPTVCSRIIPFFEALSSISIFYLARRLYGRLEAYLASTVLSLTPSFVYFTGIADPQSFTLFLIPLVMLIVTVRGGRGLGIKYTVILGLMLTVSFLMHLSYFLLIICLLLYTIGLVVSRRASGKVILEVLASIGISQLAAAPWWFPRNLYWWWIHALVTSSGYMPPFGHLEYYGPAAAVVGIVALVFSLNRWRRHLPVILWSLVPLLETQNETIIRLIGKPGLAWTTLAKPLEGFRFYPFAAQPLALLIAVLLTYFIYKFRHGYAITFLVISALAVDLYGYGLDWKLTNAGITIEEYQAAVWFKQHTNEDARICADYYRAQMFAGVCGGRALLGGVFPLRNVDYPYIKAPGQVQNDLYILYSTTDPYEAWSITRRYGVTHIYISTPMMQYGNLLSYYKPASEFGVDTDLNKFNNSSYFETFYYKDTGYGFIWIVKVKP